MSTRPPSPAPATHRDLASLDASQLSVLGLLLLGNDPDEIVVAAVLGIEPDAARSVIEVLRADGFVDDRDTLVEPHRRRLAGVLGENRVHALARRLLTHHVAAGTLTLPVARAVAKTGVRSSELSEFLCSRAELADPAEAVSLYGDAERVGRLDDAAVLGYAEACALSGDLDTAVGLADSVLERSASVSDADLAAAVRVSAAGAAYCGMIDRSAELYAWLGPSRVGSDASVAASVLVVAGRLDEAQSVLAASAGAPPTATTAGAALVATGLVHSVTGSANAALNSLTRALSLPGRAARPRVLPDSPAAITALAALHCGELAHAEAVLARARESDRPGSVTANRHHLLTAWTSMVRGDLPSAQARLDSLDVDTMHQRDLLFVHGLRVGLARRTGDNAALLQAWAGAQGVLAEYSVDLLSLLPLGELWLTSIRVGEAARITHLVENAQSLVRTLGEPAMWASALHWYGVQASILAECPADLIPHARALGEASKVSAYAAGLAGAGRAWLRVLQGDIDVAAVEDAARTLDRIGLPWDGARLAGEAALRASDTRVATALLQVARALRQPAATATGAEPATVAGPSAPGTLTDREAEVAELLVQGLTYREIGSRLYISAKTIEHHVARIRRRLGAESRSELLSMLRAMGHGTTSDTARS
ncbi:MULTISPECIES: LuxR C-terminal-related transcriptional regulator [Rhodococcus]|uniref:LuxR C-terminal-related transcriptional regulator n=1 Tax=Rhodococcus oxybenzonivorans TaxID=1990687 RepID=A0AAE4UZT7_9NOCA|nr:MULTISPECIES: LuxR C-terminal-related transcriptional regulator [Rhodococcus]MDV7243760.1 LuxR C-terminal-related transcriptional regulator [Rhodococcus oxybenzonivorans]MDV7265349.1 LuxR C-terminal-related transcriptional regulator [Rhodococcus oxybenzonivorans]MDV7274998.1 LuxR C-terminal-related transcriptional regulator [Rhodococcus oxybenzonivorans]MDV7335236.1 LuxR C-terminal-related transcriptional regulator [Rhodococcus oxybenzonivorans]MDV7345947.1 LuxR C-terminal-related transcrip